MTLNERNLHFGRLLCAECHRLHITRDQIRAVSGIKTGYVTGVRQG